MPPTNTMFSLPGAETPRTENSGSIAEPGKEYFDSQFAEMTADIKDEVEQAFFDAEFTEITPELVGVITISEALFVGESIHLVRAKAVEHAQGNKASKGGPMSKVMGLFKDII